MRYLFFLFYLLITGCAPSINKIICFHNNFCIISSEGTEYKNLFRITKNNEFIPVIYDIKSVKGKGNLLLIESYRKDLMYKVNLDNLSLNKSNVNRITHSEYINYLDSIEIKYKLDVNENYD